MRWKIKQSIDKKKKWQTLEWTDKKNQTQKAQLHNKHSKTPFNSDQKHFKTSAKQIPARKKPNVFEPQINVNPGATLDVVMC